MKEQGLSVPVVKQGKKVGIVLLWVIALVALSYLSFKTFVLVKKVHDRWSEIVFAYEKPNLVKSVKEDYDAQVEKAEQNIEKRAQTEKLIQEAANKLRSEGLK